MLPGMAKLNGSARCFGFDLFGSFKKRSMSPRPEYHRHRGPERFPENKLRQAVRALTRVLDAQNRHGEWPDQACSPARHGDGHGGTSQDGSSASRQEGSKEIPSRGNAGNVFTTTRDGEGTGKVPNDLAPGTGGPAFSRGEALLSLSSWPTNGVCRKIGRRGSLVG